MQPHFEQTQHDALAHPVSLFVQDTTDLSFSQLEHAQGFGPVGDRRGSGLHVHTLLTLTPTGEVLGLAAQHCWARPIAPAFRQTESRAQRQVRKGEGVRGLAQGSGRCGSGANGATLDQCRRPGQRLL